VFEDDDLIVINKPSGMVVHPAPGTPGGTLVNALIHHCGDTLSGVGGMKRPGIVHRIDKETTGLLVVAKSDKAHHGLAAQFADHTVARRYLAVCYGVPDSNEPRLRGVRGTSFEPGTDTRGGGEACCGCVVGMLVRDGPYASDQGSFGALRAFVDW